MLTDAKAGDDSVRDRADAYTLIEVLVAMALLAVAVVPLMTSYVVSWRSSQDAHRRSRAIMLSRWKLGQLRAVQGFSGVSSQDRTSCTLKPPYDEVKTDRYDCTVKVNQYSDFHAAANQNPKRVTVTVLYDSPFGGESSVKLSSTLACLNTGDCP